MSFSFTGPLRLSAFATSPRSTPFSFASRRAAGVARTPPPETDGAAVAPAVAIGVTLVADGLGFHIPKGYIYVAMGFSVLVEGLNLRAARRRRAGRARGASERRWSLDAGAILMFSKRGVVGRLGLWLGLGLPLVSVVFVSC